MEIHTTKIERIDWDFDQFGKFQAVLTDGQLSNIELYRITGQCNGALCTDDIEYVRAVHKALDELLWHLDRGNPNAKISGLTGLNIPVEYCEEDSTRPKYLDNN